MRKLVFFLVLLSGFRFTGFAQKIDLNHWKVTHENDTIPHDFTMPGSLYQAYNMPGKNPLVDTFEKHFYWMNSIEFELETHFEAADDVLAKPLQALVLPNLPANAKVWFNNEPLHLSTQWINNSFIKLTFNISNLLVKNNHIKIIIPALKQPSTLDFDAPIVTQIGAWAVNRQPAYRFGWDWAPALNAPIFEEAPYITAYDSKWWDFSAFLTKDKSNEYFLLHVGWDFTLSAKANESVQLFWNDSLIWEGLPYVLPYYDQNAWPVFELSNLNPWQVESPHCYILKAKYLADGVLREERKLTMGWSDFKIDTLPDDRGNRFAITNHGKKLFWKGANWVPFEVFKPITDSLLLAQLLLYKSANANALRVWGGGNYYPDRFYDLCDSLGIMIWHDFMFANSLYPTDKSALLAYKTEVLQQLNRLRHHPSIALWCGNNEVSEGWNRWGWKAGLSFNAIQKLDSNYRLLFNVLLPQWLAQETQVPYWPSSPMLGRGDSLHTNKGDSHYWSVWHDAAPFENYKKYVPRFMSEFGFQSYPSTATLKQMTTDLSVPTRLDPVWKQHQKHTRGDTLIATYLEKYFYTPTTTEDWVYLSQLQQAFGMEMGAKAHRAAYPYCTGSLVWQWNDCWPAISWSLIDYAGVPKAAFYALKQIWHNDALDFQDTLHGVALRFFADRVPNDTKPVALQWWCFADSVLIRKGKTFLNPTESINLTLTKKEIKKYKNNSLCWAVTLNNEIIQTYWPSKPNTYHLAPPVIDTAWVKNDQGWAIQLKANQLCRGVTLFADQHLNLDRNCIALLPNLPATLQTKIQSDLPPSVTIKYYINKQ